MKIFLAGLDTAPPMALAVAEKANASVLMSYYFFAKKLPAVLKIFWRPYHVFIDSGGFSAREHGIQIDVRKYRDMLLELRGHFDYCANLDTSSIEESINNQRVLEAAGLEPVPVYHFSEYLDPRYRTLIRSWAREYKMIAISLASKLPGEPDIGSKYLDYVFNATGLKVRVHGFGATRQDILEQYPFYSVDSTTWVASSKYGASFEFAKGKIIRRDKPGSGSSKDPWSSHVLVTRHARMAASVKAYIQLEKHITAYWTKRGVTWN